MGKICIGNLINENGSLAIFYLEQENPDPYKVSMDGWDVEICKDVIAAFTTQILDVEQLHKRAYMVCEQALDILAFGLQGTFLLPRPAPIVTRSALCHG